MPLEPLSEPIHHPMFNLARGTATVTSPPPFSFENVTMRFFPLRANFLTLSNLIDQYLNIAPEFAYFRPSMPFVMLTIVNYGKMGLDAGNLGWTSQNEVLFSVPLDWYVPGEDKEWEYYSPAQVAPFIFVDNEASQIAGREVFGWPKVQGWFARNIDAWAENPRNHRKLLSVDSHVFEQLYSGDRPEPRRLLEIDEEPQPSFTIFPPEPDSPLNPMVSFPNAMLAWSKLFLQGTQDLSRLPTQGYSDLDRNALPAFIENMLGNMRSFVETVPANTINLKQFRDAENPTQVCYQALTNARMDITQFRRGGMLGDMALLRGDPTGGYRVRVHQYESQPIVDTLGLETTAETGEIATLEPVMPFWCQLDLRYLTGQNLCWRTKELSWRDDEMQLAAARRKKGSTKGRPVSHAYNTTGSTGFQVATGPFRFPGATLRVLPLLADPERLRSLCDTYLNQDAESGEQNEKARFEPWGRYVYMIVTSIDTMSSESNNIGLWGNRQVEFAIPVRWYEPDENGDECLSSAGFFSPFLFADGGIQTTTGREVNGWPTVAAAIASPLHPWLGGEGPVAKVTPLLELRTGVYEALGMGQESEWSDLLQIVEGDSILPGDHAEWNHVAETWGKPAKAELARLVATAKKGSHFETLRTMGLELLGNSAPFNQISLKQFRDAEHPTRACYQSLVNCRTSIERVHDLREIEKRLHVRLHRYPTQPIVDMLGLVVKSREMKDEGIVDVLQPSRPFYMRVDLRTDLGDNLCWRAGSLQWESGTDDIASNGYLTDGKRKAVGTGLLRRVADRPKRVRNTIQEWQAEASEKDRLDPESARRAIASDAEPQMVVHSMLSTELEHGGNPRWWQEWVRRRTKNPDGSLRSDVPIARLPYFVMRRDCVGSAHDQLFPAKGCVENLGDQYELDDDMHFRQDAGYWSPDPKFGPAPLPKK